MRSRDARLNAWLAAVLLSAIGCASLQPVRDPAQFIPQHLPARVWVVTTNNATLAVAQPRIDGDTLRGTWEGRSAPLAVPLRDIERVEAVQRDKTKTIVLVATLATLTAAGVYGFTRRGGGACTPVYDPGDPEGDITC